MAERLSHVLRRLRGIRGATLREVDAKTGISNAYLSQLENGNASNPSPHLLLKLAEYYDVPYESLLEAAGYLHRSEGSKTSGRVSALQAALLGAQLTDDEQVKVGEFIEFLRMQRTSRKGSS
ncbi:MAG TPA: helix-turn-helix transcriptional regulator [Thermoanaerobaculia bacterium]|nr:helix-turn-helix transcriptional regulator [Thermoanaerobaculia bacterium]